MTGWIVAIVWTVLILCGMGFMRGAGGDPKKPEADPKVGPND